MGNIKKIQLQYSQIDSDYLASTPIRRLVRNMRKDQMTSERISKMKLTILAVQLYINRNEGFYAKKDDVLYDAIAEDTDIDDDEIKEDIKWLAEHGYYDFNSYQNNIITSELIQTIYFSVAGRLKREMPDAEHMKYVLIKNVESYYNRRASNSCPRHISSEEKRISAEEKPDSSEEMPISTEEKPDSSEEMPISTEENARSSSKYKENGYVEELRSSCSSSMGPYNDDENYRFYILFFLLDILDPANEVENFVNYNESRGWEGKNGAAKYDNPKKRFALALNYGRNALAKKGRLQIIGIEEVVQKNAFKKRILAFLFELYLFYQGNTKYRNNNILNPNTSCQFVPLDNSKFKIKLFVGPKTAAFLKSDYENVLDIGQKIVGLDLQKIEFEIAETKLRAIEPMNTINQKIL